MLLLCVTVIAALSQILSMFFVICSNYKILSIVCIGICVQIELQANREQINGISVDVTLTVEGAIFSLFFLHFLYINFDTYPIYLYIIFDICLYIIFDITYRRYIYYVYISYYRGLIKRRHTPSFSQSIRNVVARAWFYNFYL